MEQALEIIKALLQLVAQAQFTNDVEGARKITMITQAAAQFVQSEPLEGGVGENAEVFDAANPGEATEVQE